jgi:hypothetical protein
VCLSGAMTDAARDGAVLTAQVGLYEVEYLDFELETTEGVFRPVGELSVLEAGTIVGGVVVSGSAGFGVEVAVRTSI